jgi:hypothetical protein
LARLTSYEDVNYGERVRHDPAMRWIVGDKASHGCAASPRQGSRKDMVQARRLPHGVVLDMDASSLQIHPGCAIRVSLRPVLPETPQLRSLPTTRERSD